MATAGGKVTRVSQKFAPWAGANMARWDHEHHLGQLKPLHRPYSLTDGGSGFARPDGGVLAADEHRRRRLSGGATVCGQQRSRKTVNFGTTHTG